MKYKNQKKIHIVGFFLYFGFGRGSGCVFWGVLQGSEGFFVVFFLGTRDRNPNQSPNSLPNPCFLHVTDDWICQIGGLVFSPTLRPEMITLMIWKKLFCVTNVCASRKLMYVIGMCTESTLWRRPNYTKLSLPESPCVTDVLCNWENWFPINKHVCVCVCHH